MRRFCGQFGMREKSEDAEPVVDGDGDDAFARHALAVVARLGAVARQEAAAEEVHEHGQALAGALGRGPDVEVQAILAHAVERKFMSPNSGSCMQRGPNCLASLTPSQWTAGAGGAKRRFPVGGSANGTPRKTRSRTIRFLRAFREEC